MTTENGHRYTNLVDALEADYRASKQRGRGASYIANEFGCSDSTIYKFIEGERPFPMRLIGQWAKVTQSDCAVKWVVKELGLAYVPMPSSDNHAMCELAEMVESCASSAVASMKIYADGQMDKREAFEDAPPCLDKLRETVQVVLSVIEKVEYDKTHANDAPKTLAEAETTEVA